MRKSCLYLLNSLQKTLEIETIFSEGECQRFVRAEDGILNEFEM
jgi:hypothetical protein